MESFFAEVSFEEYVSVLSNSNGRLSGGIQAGLTPICLSYGARRLLRFQCLIGGSLRQVLPFG